MHSEMTKIGMVSVLFFYVYVLSLPPLSPIASYRFISSFSLNHRENLKPTNPFAEFLSQSAILSPSPLHRRQIPIAAALQTHLRRPPENPKKKFDRRPTPGLQNRLDSADSTFKSFPALFPKSFLTDCFNSSSHHSSPKKHGSLCSTTHFPPKSHLKLFQFRTRHARRRNYIFAPAIEMTMAMVELKKEQDDQKPQSAAPYFVKNIELILVISYV